MFADDIVFMAENPEDLQHLLDVAYMFSRRWGFKWNVKKSNTVRFGTGKREIGKESLSWCARAQRSNILQVSWHRVGQSSQL
jgi:hypothetical protein